MQRTHRFERGQNTIDAIELAAMGLRIEMTAGDDRCQIVVAPIAPREDITHIVDA